MPSMLDAQRSGIGSLAKLGDGVRANSDAKTQAGLGRGAGQGKKLSGSAITQTYPLSQATLDIDFANNRSYVKGSGSGGTGSAFDYLSFSRASNATYFGSDGLLKTTGFPQPYQATTDTLILPNYSLYSQTFTTGWTYGSVTPSDNVTTAPDGTITGGKWVASVSASTNHSIAPPSPLVLSNLGGFNYLYYSIYVKSAEYNRITLRTAEGSGATYDVSTGTIVFQNSGVTPTITPVGNGWYRCGFLFQTTNINYVAQIFMCRNTDTGVPSFIGDGVSGIFVWGFQIENIANSNYRLDYLASYTDYPKNNFNESENLTNATYWTTNFTTVTTDGTLAPNGLTQATLLTVTADNQEHYLISVGGGTWGAAPSTFSIYAKIGTASRFRIFNAGGYGADFDLSTQQGTFFNSSFVYNITVEPLANGWFRCSFVGLQVANNGNVRIYILNSSGIPVYAGSGQSMYFFGAQSERVAGYPTNAPNNFLVGSYSPKRNLQTFVNSPLVFSAKAGFRSEQSKTNYVLWCRDFTQSSWTQTNITRALNQTGIDGVVNSASSLTASAGNATIFQAITLASNQVVFSVFIKAITVTGNIQATINNGTTWFDIQGLSTSSWNRVAVIASSGITNPTIGLRIINNGDSIAVDYAQLEISSTSDQDFTNPIYTSASTATRAADLCSLPTTVWMNQLEGTISGRYYATFGQASITNSGKQICGTCPTSTTSGTNIVPSYSSVCAIQRGSGNNLGYARLISGNCIPNSTINFSYSYRSNGTNRIATNNSIPQGSLIFRAADTNFSNELRASYEFPLAFGGNQSWAYYNQSTFFIGSGGNGALNGVIYRITYTPKFLSTEANAEITNNEYIL